MKSKPWWLSKAIWAGVFTTLIGVYVEIKSGLASGCGQPEQLCVIIPEIPGWFMAAAGALGIYGRVSANKKIE